MMELQNTPTALLIGGDQRMAHTASILQKAGYAVFFRGRESAPSLSPAEASDRSADLVILPIPVTRDGLHLNAPLASNATTLGEIVLSLRPGQVVASGTLPPAIAEAIRAKGCKLYDYQADERFALWNALATAEGAISLAITESGDLLAGSNSAVLGFGRIGKQLCRLLSLLGAKVTVLARREEDRALASSLGYNALPFTKAKDVFQNASLIFNTVPTQLFQFTTMKLAPDAVVIDLAPIYDASDSPKVIRAAALPAKYAPAFAGRLIGECILAHLRKEAAV